MKIDAQKQLSAKLRYFGRVDIPASIEGIALLRKKIIEEIGKYPESMKWPAISPEHFIDAIQRHLNKIYEAGDPFALDEETGLPHIFAIQFNAMVLEMKRRENESVHNEF